MRGGGGGGGGVHHHHGRDQPDRGHQGGRAGGREGLQAGGTGGSGDSCVVPGRREARRQGRQERTVQVDLTSISHLLSPARRLR